MDKILISIKDNIVTIYDGGLKNISSLSDWKGNSKEEILLEYKTLRRTLKGGENI